MKSFTNLNENWRITMKKLLFYLENAQFMQLFSTFVPRKGRKDYEGQKEQYIPTGQ